jgi:hypothetical protein
MALHKLTGKLKEKVDGASSLLSDFKDESKEKIIDQVNSLGPILPIIAEVGYQLEAFNIVLSIPPGISLQFKKVKDVPKEKIDRILEQNKDKELLKMVVTSLVSADALHNRVKVGTCVFTGVLLDLSIPPKVHLKFGRK